jgi:hypothetical protein
MQATDYLKKVIRKVQKSQKKQILQNYHVDNTTEYIQANPLLVNFKKLQNESKKERKQKFGHILPKAIP